MARGLVKKSGMAQPYASQLTGLCRFFYKTSSLLKIGLDLKTGEFSDSCNARQPIYMYFQSIFRVQNSEQAFHLFSVDSEILIPSQHASQEMHIFYGESDQVDL